MMKLLNKTKIQIIFIKIYVKIARIYWHIFKPRALGCGVIIKNGNKILLIKNTYRSNWYAPGGGNNKGELLINTAIRETKEEIGIVLDKDDLKLIGVYQNNTEGKENINMIFLAEKNISLNQLNIDKTEISEANYFDLDNLPDKLSHSIKFSIKTIKEGKYPMVGHWGKYKE